MSEYWKSTPKYWCKHCSAYVKDTPFERKQHESTGKHQGNLKRFLRGIQNDHERNEREKEKAKAEVDRLNRVVGAGTSGTLNATPSSSKQNKSHKSNASNLTAVDQKRQWAQLAEMGIEVPDNFRGELAMPGQWETVSKPGEELSPASGILSTGVRKRRLEGEEDEDNVGNVERRGWGATTRRFPKQEDLDLDALLTSALLKKENGTKEESPSKSEPPKTENSESGRASSMNEEKTLPDEIDHESQAALKESTESAGKTAVKSENSIQESVPLMDNVPEVTAVPVFKKRKVKSQAPSV